MSKGGHTKRTLRAATVPVPSIVATDPVAVGTPVTAVAPEFPGVADADTPVYDQLLADMPLTMTPAEADAMINEGVESWGLDEIAPLPIESMIKDLVAQVGDGTAWTIEQEVGADAWHRRALNLGEVDNDDTDDGPAGDAELGDGPGGPAVVDDDHNDDPGDQG